MKCWMSGSVLSHSTDVVMDLMFIFLRSGMERAITFGSSMCVKYVHLGRLVTDSRVEKRVIVEEDCLNDTLI